jgi:hypothetical protein
MYDGDGHAGNCLRTFDRDDYRYLTFKDSMACKHSFIDKTRTDICVPGRMQHRFRGRKVHGKLTISSHGDYTCYHCRKTFAEVMRVKAEYGRKK